MTGNSTENTIQSAVYDALRQAIMTLHLVPGAVMSTQEIATKLKVSRTPVRDAFLRLQREGLVIIIPQRETMVSRIDLKRVEEERFIRESLEMAIIDSCIQHCKPSHLKDLRDMITEQNRLWQEKRYADFVSCDNQWHKMLFDIAEKTLAWETMMLVNGHYNRIRVLTVQTAETTAGVLQQHSRIVDQMERGDASAMRAEIANHVAKLNVEKSVLVRLYPDYFESEEEPKGILLGSL